ncbi:MAG: hypothetical protein ABI824_18155 [Acidobacteriota bacterium]
MRYRRITGLALFAGFCFVLQGQDGPLYQNSHNPATYEAFFQAVTHWPPATTRAALNGSTTEFEFVTPSIEEAIGITAAEAQTLRTIAADFDEKNEVIRQAIKPLVFETRLANLEEAARSNPVAQQYSDLGRQRTQLILDHLETLKTALGEARFRLVEAFVNSKKDSQTFFERRKQ